MDYFFSNSFHTLFSIKRFIIMPAVYRAVIQGFIDKGNCWADSEIKTAKAVVDVSNL